MSKISTSPRSGKRLPTPEATGTSKDKAGRIEDCNMYLCDIEKSMEILQYCTYASVDALALLLYSIRCLLKSLVPGK